jgi:integrase
MYTGARTEELASMMIEHVDLAEKTMAIVDAKTPAGSRVVPLHATAGDGRAPGEEQ